MTTMNEKDILDSMFGGLSNDGDDDGNAASFDIGGVGKFGMMKFPEELAERLGKKKRKPSRTVEATDAVKEAAKKNDRRAKEIFEEVKPHIDAIQAALKEAIRIKHKFWSLIEVEMDLGEPMSLSYNGETNEVEIYEDEE